MGSTCCAPFTRQRQPTGTLAAMTRASRGKRFASSTFRRPRRHDGSRPCAPSQGEWQEKKRAFVRAFRCFCAAPFISPIHFLFSVLLLTRAADDGEHGEKGRLCTVDAESPH